MPNSGLYLPLAFFDGARSFFEGAGCQKKAMRIDKSIDESRQETAKAAMTKAERRSRKFKAIRIGCKNRGGNGGRGGRGNLRGRVSSPFAGTWSGSFSH